MDSTIGAGPHEYLGVHHDDRCGKSRSRDGPWRAILAAVTDPAIRHELDRLPEADQAGGARAILHRRHLEAMLCAARLQEAIAGAERWYAQREDELRQFDRRATATVWRLVADDRVRPSLAWSPHGPVAAKPSRPVAEVMAIAVHRRNGSSAPRRAAEAA
jgi:hypothetical protein